MKPTLNLFASLVFVFLLLPAYSEGEAQTATPIPPTPTNTPTPIPPTPTATDTPTPIPPTPTQVPPTPTDTPTPLPPTPTATDTPTPIPPTPTFTPVPPTPTFTPVPPTPTFTPVPPTPTFTPVPPTPTFTPVPPTPTFTPVPPTPTFTPTPPCPPCDCLVKDLWAGRDEWVGTVEICADTLNSVLSVTLDISGSNLCFDETHVYANRDNPSTPPDNGAPGRFPFKHEDLSETECVQVDPYVITDFDLGCDEIAALAAHAVVCEPTAEADWRTFLDIVDRAVGTGGRVMTRFDRPDTEGPLEVEILGGGTLTGVFPGLFVDVDRKMSPRTVYFAELVSTLATDHDGSVVPNPAAARLVEYPDNLDAVNWLINENFPGQVSTCGGTFTESDVQRAVWDLVEDDQSVDGLGKWSQCRVNEILAAAAQKGHGFVPSCDQSAAVILNPVGLTGENIARIGIAHIKLSQTGALCQHSRRDCETAWGQSLGGDIPFPRGGGWGSYFEYLCE